MTPEDARRLAKQALDAATAKARAGAGKAPSVDSGSDRAWQDARSARQQEQPQAPRISQPEPGEADIGPNPPPHTENPEPGPHPMGSRDRAPFVFNPPSYSLRDEATIPKREWLYQRQYLRGVVGGTLGAPGRLKSTTSLTEAIGLAAWP
jgi:hypothetical protein